MKRSDVKIEGKPGEAPRYEARINGRTVRFNPFPGAKIMPCGKVACPAGVRLMTLAWKARAGL